MSTEENSEITFAEFALHPRRRQLVLDGRPVSLTARAFDLLFFLIQNAGRVVSKEEILDTVWKDQFVEESNLAVQISAIRRALGDKASDPRFLVTIPGKGYQFIAPVSVGSDLSGRGVAVSEGKDNSIHTDIAGTPGRNNRFPTALSIVVAAAVLIAASFLFYKYAIGPPVSAVRSIAVLPFAEQANDTPASFLGDGLAESVIFSLSRVPGIRVVSRESAFSFRGGINAKAIGNELNVESILTGRILRSGESLSVRAQLVSTTDDSVIWSEEFSKTAADLQRLQIDIAESISRELKIKLTGSQEALLQKAQTENVGAYNLYLLGRFHLNQLTDDGFVKGRDAFRQAVEKDPNYALAHAGLADAYNLLCGWGAMKPNEGYPLAKASAIRSLELDESLAEAHTALGVVKLFYDADWSGAETEFRRAIELNPNYSDAHMMYGHELTLLGRFAEAKPYMIRAAELDPLSIIKVVSIGNVSYFERDFAEALNVYQRALEMDSNSGLAHWSVGNALLASGRQAEAISEFQKAVSLSGDSPDEPASIGLAYAMSGNQIGARDLITDLTERSQKTYVPPLLLASIYGALGQRDKAFELIEQGFRERDYLLVYLKVDPMFDALRQDARFPELLRRLQFQ